MCDITRRGFMVGCSAAVAAMAGARFNTVAFAGEGDNDQIMIVLFLRGGVDGLNLVPPIDGADRGYYETLRPNLKIPTSGPNAALPFFDNAQFGLHPQALPLMEIYEAGKLAIVQAAGLGQVNRSHFDAMISVELGTPDMPGTPTGWLTRHLSSAPNLPEELIMPSLAVGDLQPQSLRGNFETLNLVDPSNFNISTGPWLWRHPQRLGLRRLYQSGDSWLHITGDQALNAMDIIELNVGGGYEPPPGVTYPDSDFGEHLQVLAQLIKLELGLQVATLDVGGWDTHDQQGNGGGGYFGDLVGDLALGLNALLNDLASGSPDYTQRVTLIVQSEFGRELRENSDAGTEHGYGNNILVLGGNVNGGFHGSWPGLAPGQLFEGTDLAVTNDYRRILSEILIRRMENPYLGQIFPGYSGYSPLGVVQGVDIPPIYEGELFSDGFESGDTSRWSQVNSG
jgi:uncharacterized protein (DUF1501 family)